MCRTMHRWPPQALATILFHLPFALRVLAVPKGLRSIISTFFIIALGKEISILGRLYVCDKFYDVFVLTHLKNIQLNSDDNYTSFSIHTYLGFSVC